MNGRAAAPSRIIESAHLHLQMRRQIQQGVDGLAGVILGVGRADNHAQELVPLVLRPDDAEIHHEIRLQHTAEPTDPAAGPTAGSPSSDPARSARLA